MRYGLTAAFTLVLAGLLWLAVTAGLARNQVQASQQAVGQLRTALLQGDLPAAHRAAGEVTGHARSAHRLTTGPAWWISTRIPWLGQPARSIRGCAAEADQVGSQVLPPLLGLADTLTPGSLVNSGTVRLQPLVDAAPVLHQAEARLRAGTEHLDRLPADTWLAPADRSRASLRDSLARIADQLRPAGEAADLLPDLLGRTGTRRYFVGLENEAESRGIGGIPGAFAIVTASQGRVSFDRFDSDTALSRVRTGSDLYRDLGSEYARRYRAADPMNTFANSTISPDFSEAARIWAAMWQAATGQRIDGALAIDPTAISYLLKVTGPAPLADGSSVTGDEVVSLTQQTLYRTHPDKAARKAYLIQIARAVSARLLSARGSVELVRAATRAAGEHRLLVWSADDDVQQRLAASPVSGVLRAGPGYLAGFGTVNATGGKLDYYLTRSMTYSRQGCGAGSTSTSTFTLANEVPAGPLPGYVTLRLDAPGYRTRPGDNKVLVSYYGTPGSQIATVTLDGRPVVTMPSSEHGLVVLTLPVELARGARHTVTVTAIEPARAARTEILRQPAVHPVSVTTQLPGCDAGAASTPAPVGSR
ncbi:DUF4012 domain-containing protein [Jatrophihabitans sp.]|uniref:DUF4012 domain-containing protein n=1 Tax=Jatrophihabitans sp. TaxID=1932789 RepID=UPI002CA4832C|nr:DUF4012 domain-containing protein [Jatrophihabitans sp.]